MSKVEKKLTVEESRKIQMEILDEIADFCEKEGLKYYIIAGTLIGAVRHKGYIPWDDDIDIAMLRKDYDQFVQSYKSSQNYLLNANNTKNYPYPFSKVCRNGTKVIENTYMQNHSSKLKHFGINIDIFPIDKVADDKKKRDKIFKKEQRYLQILAIKGLYKTTSGKWYKELALKIIKGILLPLKPNQIARRMQQIAKSCENDEANFCCNVVWGIGEKEKVCRDVFSKTTKLLFEDRQYCAPVGWDEWLSNRYGEYMTFPPKEKQIPHFREDYIISK